MAEFLAAVQWLQVLLAHYRRQPNIDDQIARPARGLDEANRAGAIVQRGRKGCAGCRYYVATRGACHVLPPVQRRGDNHPWPLVQPSDWCGTFSPVLGDEA